MGWCHHEGKGEERFERHGGSRNDKTWETDMGARENEKSKIALEL